MAYQECKTLSAYGVTGLAVPGNQLTDLQRKRYSKDWSISLASSGFNNPVGATELAAHMFDGRAVVVIEPEETEAGLLAQAYLTPPINGATILGGLHSSRRGFGGLVVKETAGLAMSSEGIISVHANVRPNNTRGLAMFAKICGTQPELQTLEEPETGRQRQIAVFDLTEVGRNHI